MKLSIREAGESDVPLIGDYWFTSSEEHLVGMGVDVTKMMPRQDMEAMLSRQFGLPLKERNSFCLIWEVDGEPIGHCNTNPTEFGKEAKMHLHIWKPELRRKGIGQQLLRMSVERMFDQLDLKRLICEPYALNPSPNKAVEKIGFKFDRAYTCVPGGHNFEQKVNRWVLQPENLKPSLG